MMSEDWTAAFPPPGRGNLPLVGRRLGDFRDELPEARQRVREEALPAAAERRVSVHAVAGTVPLAEGAVFAGAAGRRKGRALRRGELAVARRGEERFPTVGLDVAEP